MCLLLLLLLLLLYRRLSIWKMALNGSLLPWSELVLMVEEEVVMVVLLPLLPYLLLMLVLVLVVALLMMLEVRCVRRAVHVQITVTHCQRALISAI